MVGSDAQMMPVSTSMIDQIAASVSKETSGLVIASFRMLQKMLSQAVFQEPLLPRKAGIGNSGLP